jgi:hypothetical protein
MPLGWGSLVNARSGVGGTAGGFAAAGTSTTTVAITGLAYPGTGGGGLPAAGNAGTNGGAYATIGSNLFFPNQPGGTGAPNATTPPTSGSNGISDIKGLFYAYGGTGGGSTHGSATGAGLVGASGGSGTYGSGGGGGGGALTGTTAGTTIGGNGGDSIAIIYAW